MKYNLGIDIGSISVKIALLDEFGKVARLNSSKITSNPKAALNLLLTDLNSVLPLEKITSVGVSGSGKGIIPLNSHGLNTAVL